MKHALSVLLILCMLFAAVPAAFAATEDDARAAMAACGVGDPVAEKDNLMGMSIKDVRLDKDGDVTIQWAFANELMRSNLTYAFIQVRFFDPANLSAPYSAFTVTPERSLSLTFKEGDMVNYLDFVHLKHEEFNPDVILMYFNGSGDGAPESLYTVPLVFAFYVDDAGPHAVETTPRYAPDAMIGSFDPV